MISFYSDAGGRPAELLGSFAMNVPVVPGTGVRAPFTLTFNGSVELTAGGSYYFGVTSPDNSWLEWAYVSIPSGGTEAIWPRIELNNPQGWIDPWVIRPRAYEILVPGPGSLAAMFGAVVVSVRRRRAGVR